MTKQGIREVIEIYPLSHNYLLWMMCIKPWGKELDSESGFSSSLCIVNSCGGFIVSHNNSHCQYILFWL